MVKTVRVTREIRPGYKRHSVALHYRGLFLKTGTWSIVHPQWHYTPLIDAGWRRIAIEQGFTHIKFDGDWTGLVKPKGGLLKRSAK